MKLETLRVERRKSGRLDVQLQLSTNPNELQENFRLLKNGVPVPALEAIFVESNSHVAMIRPNLLLEPQKEFIRITRIATTRKLHHQLIGARGGGVDEFTNIGN